MAYQPPYEALQFVADACARLNNEQAVQQNNTALLAEEITDIENVVLAALGGDGNHQEEAMLEAGSIALDASFTPRVRRSLAFTVYQAMERQRLADDRAMRSEAMRARTAANYPWPEASP